MPDPVAPVSLSPSDGGVPGRSAMAGLTDLSLLGLLEGVGDGVWDWDIATGREYFSPRLKAIYGYGDADELQFAADLDSLTHPDDVPRMQADRQAHWSGQAASYRNEHRVRHKDGRWIWVLSRGLVVSRAANGQPLRMVGTHTDITERKLAELALRATRERLELATRGSNDGLWDWDMVTDQVYYSPRFQALLAYPSPEVFDAQFSFRSHLHPDDVERVMRQWHAHLRGHSPGFDQEYRLRCHNGAYRWFHGRGQLVCNDQGAPVRFAGHLTDVTERVNAQTAQQGLEDRLRESQKLEALGNLAAGVAKAFSKLLNHQLDALTQVRRELPVPHPALVPLAGVAQAVAQAQTLVDQILVFSRRLPQRMTVLEWGGLVAQCVGQAQPGLPDGATLRCTPAAEPVHVLADASQMQQAVLNLCTFAVQALRGRVGEVLLSVSPCADGAGANLVVQDTGPGTSPEVLRRLFEPFFAESPDGLPAAGLGLAVVHGIVQAHQGRIEVFSVPGRGTRFELWLPRVAAPQPLPVLAPAPSVPAVPVPPPGNPLTRHVVYIDDYEAMVYLITRMLKKRGYRVSAFERAEQALAFIEAHPNDLDLLVTDYNMPTFSGLDVVRRVKRVRPDVPMVITSGHVTPGMQAEALTEGVTQVLSKQDSVEDLAAILAELLESLPPPSPSR